MALQPKTRKLLVERANIVKCFRSQFEKVKGMNNAHAEAETRLLQIEKLYGRFESVITELEMWDDFDENELEENEKDDIFDMFAEMSGILKPSHKEEDPSIRLNTTETQNNKNYTHSVQQ